MTCRCCWTALWKASFASFSWRLSASISLASCPNSGQAHKLITKLKIPERFISFPGSKPSSTRLNGHKVNGLKGQLQNGSGQDGGTAGREIQRIENAGEGLSRQRREQNFLEENRGLERRRRSSQQVALPPERQMTEVIGRLGIGMHHLMQRGAEGSEGAKEQMQASAARRRPAQSGERACNSLLAPNQRRWTYGKLF